jgi:ankyrin repeat protein
LDIAVPNLELVKLLLDHGADINYNGGTYGTALSQAIFSFQTEFDTEPLVRELLSRNADPNIQGGRCRTPLQTVVSLWPCPNKFVGILVEAGARTELVQNPYRERVEEILVMDKLLQDVHTFENLAANVLGWRIKITSAENPVGYSPFSLLTDARRTSSLGGPIHYPRVVALNLVFLL